MEKIEGNIIDPIAKTIRRGIVFFDKNIIKIEYTNHISSNNFILPGFIDAHVHIESSMLTPLEYSKIALKHGVIAAVTDPHEIANVCGIEGINFMVDNGQKTPMKIYFGAPSCVPATDFETSGSEISVDDIEVLFKNNICSHLSEMMNYPGVIYNDINVHNKLNIARKYAKKIDGHAPMLSGADLQKYVNAGISTDHECTNIIEAIEKINLGMKIMLRNSSASKDFDTLIELILSHPNDIMFCTDDCHPDDLLKGYINKLVHISLTKGYDLFNVLLASTKNAIDHYGLDVGFLQLNDSADFIVVDNLNDFNILATFINGTEVFDGKNVKIDSINDNVVNHFYSNSIVEDDIKIVANGNSLNVIDIIPYSLLTKKIEYTNVSKSNFREVDLINDILKVVVLNRYSPAKPAVGFIKGYGLKSGAIAGTIAHDSHNIIAVGVNDESIISVINKIQQLKGGLAVYDDNTFYTLPLPVAGLMSTNDCETVAAEYSKLSAKVRELGTPLKAPFMTLAFMSLLVIPELKLGDKGLFDVSKFQFIDLQN